MVWPKVKMFSPLVEGCSTKVLAVLTKVEMIITKVLKVSTKVKMILTLVLNS